MGSQVEIFDLEQGKSVVWQIVSPIFSNIHDLERDEDILLAQFMLEELRTPRAREAMLEALKTPRELMDEIDREFGFK